MPLAQPCAVTEPSASAVESKGEAQAVVPPGVLHVRNVAFTLVSVGVVILLLQFMQPVLIPLVLAGLLFYALDPEVDWMQKHRVPRWLGAALMLAVVVAIGASLAYSLQGQASAVIDQLPTGARKLSDTLRRTSVAPSAVDKVQQAAEALQQSGQPSKPPAGVVRVQVEDKPIQASALVWSGSLGLLSAVNQFILVLFLTYFMLLSDQLFKRKLVEMVGTLSQKKLTVAVLEDIASQVERFLLIEVLTSALVAIVTWGALWAMGMHQAALWGLLAGILNSIPYYGPLVITGGLSVVGFLQFGTIGMTLAVAGVSLVITTLEGMLLTPMFIGHASSMNQVAVFAGLLFWSWVWGIWGMLLAIPLMMVVKVICDHVEPLQPVGLLLGD